MTASHHPANCPRQRHETSSGSGQFCHPVLFPPVGQTARRT
jgi:hypothetical protein